MLTHPYAFPNYTLSSIPLIDYPIAYNTSLPTALSAQVVTSPARTKLKLDRIPPTAQIVLEQITWENTTLSKMFLS